MFSLIFCFVKVYDCYLSLHQWPELIAWNDACIKMQMAFLQDDNEDLRTAMETTIDMNAIRYERRFKLGRIELNLCLER
jgi:hypothetical protein